MSCHVNTILEWTSQKVPAHVWDDYVFIVFVLDSSVCSESKASSSGILKWNSLRCVMIFNYKDECNYIAVSSWIFHRVII